jgi:hypothetical protein
MSSAFVMLLSLELDEVLHARGQGAGALQPAEALGDQCHELLVAHPVERLVLLDLELCLGVLDLQELCGCLDAHGRRLLGAHGVVEDLQDLLAALGCALSDHLGCALLTRPAGTRLAATELTLCVQTLGQFRPALPLLVTDVELAHCSHRGQ